MVTRQSLVDRLANWEDQKNWQQFFDSYWKLIYNLARRSGLTESEAQDVVQETILTVARRAGQLKYDPAIGSFKGWLLQITRWRIADEFRKRQREEPAAASSDDDTSRTAGIDRAPDPASGDLEAAWDAEWRQTLLDAATERVKRQVDPKQYQIFDCYVVKQWPALKVARELGVNVGQVYLAKHRVSSLMRVQLAQLEKDGTVL